MWEKRSRASKILNLVLAEKAVKTAIYHLMLAVNRDIDGTENIYTAAGEENSAIEILDLQELSDTLHARIFKNKQENIN